MGCIEDFWNEVAIGQMASGQAPSVKTETMQKALSGDKEASKKIESEIDVRAAAFNGIMSRVCK